MTQAAGTMQPVVGIDLGATNMQFGVVDGGNAIAGRARAKTEAAEGLDRVVDNIVEGVGSACASAGVRRDDLGAIGIAAAGAIDMPRGVILDAPNLHWHDVPLRDILTARLRRPVVLDNDVNGAVWGEYRLGAGAGRGDQLGVWVGTGIGGGLVLNGALYRGNRFTAGEIGHAVIDPDGKPQRRTVEDLCSRTGIRRTLGENLDTAAIARGYRDGDARIRDVIDDSARLLGIAIANWVTVLSLDTVILGGGITEALGEPYADRIRESFRRDVFPDALRDCEILITHLEADAAIYGAALLAREAITAPDR